MSKTIMVIEDNEDIQDIIKFVLEGEGYSVMTSIDSSLLQKITFYKPHLVILDNQLPDGLGKDFCLELKTREETMSTPILLISANTHLDVMAHDCKANGYLNKPFDIAELLSAVALHIQ